MSFTERRMGSEIQEGWGTDVDAEEVAGSAEAEEEMGNFEASFRNADNEDIFDQVIATIKKQKDPAAISAEIRRLDKRLVETQGDEEEMAEILREYVGVQEESEEE